MVWGTVSGVMGHGASLLAESRPVLRSGEQECWNRLQAMITATAGGVKDMTARTPVSAAWSPKWFQGVAVSFHGGTRLVRCMGVRHGPCPSPRRRASVWPLVRSRWRSPPICTSTRCAVVFSSCLRETKGQPPTQLNWVTHRPKRQLTAGKAPSKVCRVAPNETSLSCGVRDAPES